MTTVDIREIDPALTKAALRGGEACFGAGLICPAVPPALEHLGLVLRDLTELNFVTRSAPMGAVAAEVVQSTFFNFNPEAIEGIIPAAWGRATPEAILDAQASAFSPVLASALSGIDGSELAELAQLSRAAVEAVAPHREGRPLFAGLLSLPWPTEAHMIIWHAGKLLREHRGDGHVALLVGEGIGGIEALIIHAAFDPSLPPGILRSTRRWSREAWAEGIAELRRREWLTDDEPLTFTEQGRRRRRHIEDRTDELAAVAFQSIGSAGMARMTALGAKVAKALESAGLGMGFPARRPSPPSSS
jgi:hypothetical protein